MIAEISSPNEQAIVSYGEIRQYFPVCFFFYGERVFISFIFQLNK